MVGIMSPLVLFYGDLFPGGLPTLEAQYVLKDIVLAAAGAVVAARRWVRRTSSATEDSPEDQLDDEEDDGADPPGDRHLPDPLRAPWAVSGAETVAGSTGATSPP